MNMYCNPSNLYRIIYHKYMNINTMPMFIWIYAWLYTYIIHMYRYIWNTRRIGD